MKTLTEFSGIVIRMAAKAQADTKATFPAAAAPVAAPVVEAAPPAEGEAPIESTPVAEAAPYVPETDEQKAAIEAAITKETNVSGDRLARLREAIVAVGNKVADVRLVRVYAGEAAVTGAKKVGEHQFIVEVMPQSMKPNFARPEKDRGRGGPRKNEGGGSKAGGFSMDSIKEDRGGGGGGRGRPSGGPGGPGKPKA